jgi:hypothetical protein
MREVSWIEDKAQHTPGLYLRDRLHIEFSGLKGTIAPDS